MMKRLQIMIQPELDAALEQKALEEGTSKAALIRRYVAEHVQPLPPIEEDPLWRLCGYIEGQPDGSVSVNDAVYGPSNE